MSITFIAISRATLPQGQTRIFGCEHCTPEAELPFGWILDEVTGNSGSDVNYAQAQGRGGGPPGALELEISGSDLDCGQPLPGGGSTLCFGARLVVLVKDASTGQAVEGLRASAFSVHQPFTQQDCSQVPFPPVGFPLPGTLHLEDRPFATGVPLEVGEGLYTLDVTPAAGCFAPGFRIATLQIIVTEGNREGRTLTGAFVQGPMAPF